MISITNLSYYIGGRALYENANMFIKPKDKIGLIGLNGRGKSTLLRIINGEYTDRRWLCEQKQRLHDWLPEPGLTVVPNGRRHYYGGHGGV